MLEAFLDRLPTDSHKQKYVLYVATNKEII